MRVDLLGSFDAQRRSFSLAIRDTYYVLPHDPKFRIKGHSRVFETGETKEGWQNVSAVVKRKLDQLANAKRLADLCSPPRHDLVALKGNRKGQHSIRINDNWGVCFRWTEQGFYDVEIADYH